MRLACVFLLLVAGVVIAQEKPQLTWEGYVAGSATLYVQKDSLDVQGRTTGAVDGSRFHFAEPLPAVAQTIKLRVRRGNGTVKIVEQPSKANDFSAVIQIDNRRVGAQNYTLDFFWTSR